MPKTISAATMRNHFAEALAALNREDFLIISKREKPIGVVVNIDFFEDLLARSSPKYLRSIRQAREDFRRGRVLSHEQVFGKV